MISLFHQVLNLCLEQTKGLAVPKARGRRIDKKILFAVLDNGTKCALCFFVFKGCKLITVYPVREILFVLYSIVDAGKCNYHNGYAKCGKERILFYLCVPVHTVSRSTRYGRVLQKVHIGACDHGIGNDMVVLDYCIDYSECQLRR